jgi:hypothetical protein
MKGSLPSLSNLDPARLALEAAREASRGRGDPPFARELAEELERSGVAFASSDAVLQSQFYRALGGLFGCVLPSPAGGPMLIEGGPYRGAWLESTATIGAETLSRFFPRVARSTFELFADLRREDGLIPYKVLPSDAALAVPGAAAGPAFRQVQMVTPLARSAWIHAAVNREEPTFLSRMLEAASSNDAWLAENRDTRGTGCVEAFCAFDTGHDLSPRFWHVPDTTWLEDPARFDPGSPLLPYIAPDMTANVYCQRLYMSRIAASLGREAESSEWKSKAERSLARLTELCWDAEDEFFYDVDREGRFVRVQSDVLLRVLACEVGDDGLFSRACSRYLLNTRKFFARFPFTSIAMDDPRFDPSSAYNTWGGTTNTLSLLRAPAAFEAHGRHAELSLALGRALAAYYRMRGFGQTISPYTGAEGFTEGYSPTLLGLLDAIERLVGVLPRPDGSLWFSCMPLPAGLGGRPEASTTSYSRRVDGRLFELECGLDGARALMDGEELFSCPRGMRVATTRDGRPLSAACLSPRGVAGRIGTRRDAGFATFDFSAGPNEVLRLDGGSPASAEGPGFIAPSW